MSKYELNCNESMLDYKFVHSLFSSFSTLSMSNDIFRQWKWERERERDKRLSSVYVTTIVARAKCHRDVASSIVTAMDLSAFCFSSSSSSIVYVDCNEMLFLYNLDLICAIKQWMKEYNNSTTTKNDWHTR